MSAIPANLEPYIDALGFDGAIEFLLTFGGQTVYLAADPKGNSEIARTIGVDKARDLSRALLARTDHSYMRIPTAKPFIARHLREQGWTIGRIARRLHVRDDTVRGWMPKASRQMSLL